MFKESYDEVSGHIIINGDKISTKLKKVLINGSLLKSIQKKISTFLKKISNYFKKVKKGIDKLIGIIARKVYFRNLPINDKRVVFFTFQGKYTCNSKYIAEKLLETHPEYEIIFVVNKKIAFREDVDVPKEVKFVTKGTPECFYALGTAKFWFDNALCCVWDDVPKRKGQIYINTWHGSLGIKQLDGNVFWRGRAAVSNKKTDYFITNSVFEEHVFKESFWPDVPHLKIGHPRNDIFFDNERMKLAKKKVCEHYEISENVKIALYAPTFRDNKKNVRAIILDYDKLKNALETRFGGEWVIFMRPHFHNLKVFKFTNKRDYVIKASDYDDMQELLAAVDVGITDYSSWIFDYMLTGRPGFIYARDIDEYIDSRGFYYSLNETPFSIADNDESLCENILNFNEEEYAKAVDEFLEEKGCYEKGNASEAVVDFILSQKS